MEWSLPLVFLAQHRRCWRSFLLNAAGVSYRRQHVMVREPEVFKKI
jgi:hypothetical protein